MSVSFEERMAIKYVLDVMVKIRNEYGREQFDMMCGVLDRFGILPALTVNKNTLERT